MGWAFQHRSFRFVLPLTILGLYTLAMLPWIAVIYDQHRIEVMAQGRAELVAEGYRLEQLLQHQPDVKNTNLEQQLKLHPADPRPISSAIIDGDGLILASNRPAWSGGMITALEGIEGGQVLERIAARRMSTWTSQEQHRLHGIFPHGQTTSSRDIQQSLSGSIYLELDLSAQHDNIIRDLIRDVGLLWLLLLLATFTGGFLVHKKTRGQLSASQRQYEALTELAPVGIFRTDDEGNCVFVNARCSEMAGLAEEQLKGDGWLGAFYPDDRERVEEEWNKARENNVVFECETRLNGSEDPAVWVIVRAVPEKDAKGHTTGYVGTVTDIGSSEEVEAALQKTEHQLKEAQDHARLGYWDLDAQTGEAHWSEQLYRITGLDMSVSVGTEVLSGIIDPRDREPVLASIKRAIQEGAHHHMKYRILRADTGERRWVECSAKPVFDEKGRVIRLQGIAQDVTEHKQAELKLEQALLHADQYLDVVGVMLLGLDRNGSITLLNRRGSEILGCPQEQALGLDWIQEFIPEADREETRRMLLAFESAEPALIKHAENTIITRQGERRRIAWHNVLLKEPGGKISGILSSGEDVTSQRQTEESLRLAAGVFDNTHDGVIITDVDGSILNVNEAFSRMTGYRRDQVLGKNPSIFKSGKHDGEFYRGMWQSIEENGFWEGEITNRRMDGEPIYENLAISAVRDNLGNLTQYVGVFSDISHFKAHQERLAWQAQHDILTGLPNRLLLAERMESAFKLAKRQNQIVANCILDLDKFKPINDEYGHETGDQLLIEIAKRLTLAVRSVDTVARLGGDEFVLVLAGCNSVTEVEEVLTRVQSQLRLPVQIGEHSLHVSSSIGIALYPVNGEEADKLLRRADKAMYVVKQSGKDTFRFFDQLEEQQAKAHRQFMNEMRAALKGGELRLLYHPTIDVHQGEVSGVKALVRWEHPRDGLLLPERFLPQIESTRLAVELDQWVIGEAVRQMQAWGSGALNLSVSLNVGAHTLLDPNSLIWLRDALAGAPDLDPSRIELEILESSALSDLQLVTETINAYRELGVSFALGDFGTGYSSLTFLKKLPVQVIKMDHTFVRGMLQDPDDLAIVEGMMGLAQAFNRTVVAEGVETAEHGRLLLSMGCQKLQGYGIAKPMPPDELGDWIRGFEINDSWQQAESEFITWDLSLLSADLFHRQWVRRILERSGDAHDLGEDLLLDGNECRFGHWLNGPGSAAWGHLEAFRDIVSIHSKLHEVAQRLLIDAVGDDASALAEEKEQLLVLQEKLSDKFKQLQRALVPD